MVYLSNCVICFFHRCLFFLECKSFVSFGRFIPRYFILFAVMVNWIVSLISLSGLSLLVYQKEKISVY